MGKDRAVLETLSAVSPPLPVVSMPRTQQSLPADGGRLRFRLELLQQELHLLPFFGASIQDKNKFQGPSQSQAAT
jgi:hypothetical protein